ncbi:DNA-binding storekeeper protein-related transcriptional regulator [Raphanus sativus]|uniref:Probable transcription factor At1g61730 n=1 Tax=Raphanus sativus TaxID=3726 RepID=A0A6J0KJ98_RAPSA|nr:probable transcription factor At1g61730 [Raphanus sativus]KAJ4881623.1 DNA-binding storekeeper protein-related transcriptional regulator [Raphanus sativus]
MGKKKLNPLEDPPKSSSSDDDEMETQSGEEEEAEEQISDDSDSSSSEEEKDGLWNPVIIPPLKKPKTSVASPSKQRSKRSSEEMEAPHAKKRSKKKKPLFQRLWSEEDEISLLQGMIDFKSGTGKSPYEDMDGFYELIKKSISFEASKYQTAEKIRSLRKKYVKRGVESISKSHDMGCFNLSKYIWGSNGLALKSNVKKSDSVKPHGQEVEKEVESDANLEVNGENGDKEEEDREMLVNGKKVQVDKQVLVNGDSSASDWFEDSFLVGSIGSLGVGERFVKERWSMVAVETKKKMEEKWKLLQAKEMELVLEKTDFMREVGSVIAEAS